MKAQIVEKEGKWYFEATTKSGTCAVPMKNKELAQQLLDLHNKYYRKWIELKGDKDILTPVRVTDVALLYRDGEDNPPVNRLGFRYKNSKWYADESICTLVS